MPHAVIVSPDTSNAAGGVERMCVLLGDILEEQGWQVTIVEPERRATRWEFRLGASYLAVSRSASRAARAQRPDLLITNGFLGVGYSRQIPRVHVYHGTMVGATRATGAALPRRERMRRTVGAGAVEAFSARGATVVCVSESAASEIRRFYRVRDTKVIVNGIDTAIFAPRPRAQARQRMGLDLDGRYALFVGRMDHGKGAGLIVPATESAGLELLIAGPGGSPEPSTWELSPPTHWPTPTRQLTAYCFPVCTRPAASWCWRHWRLACPSSPRASAGCPLSWRLCRSTKRCAWNRHSRILSIGCVSFRIWTPRTSRTGLRHGCSSTTVSSAIPSAGGSCSRRWRRTQRHRMARWAKQLW